MFFNNWGQFNFGFMSNWGWNSSFYQQQLTFDRFMPYQQTSFFNFPVMNFSIFSPVQNNISNPFSFDFSTNFTSSFDFTSPFKANSPSTAFTPTFTFTPPVPKFTQDTCGSVTKSNPQPRVDNFVRTTTPLDGYNSSKGQMLVNIAKNRVVGNTGHCAKFVQEAIAIAGLGACTGVNASQMTSTLRANPNFKEIAPMKVDVSTLPAGCIVVYDKCTRYPDEIYGHVEFAVGDGSGISDGISQSLNKNPSAIFIPV